MIAEIITITMYSSFCIYLLSEHRENQKFIKKEKEKQIEHKRLMQKLEQERKEDNERRISEQRKREEFVCKQEENTKRYIDSLKKIFYKE